MNICAAKLKCKSAREKGLVLIESFPKKLTVGASVEGCDGSLFVSSDPVPPETSEHKCIDGNCVALFSEEA